MEGHGHLLWKNWYGREAHLASTFWFFGPVVFGKKSSGFGGENRPVSFWVDEVVIGEVLQQSI